MSDEDSSPQDQATNRPADASPVNGQVPPPAHRFKPGVSANPGGRPKGLSLVATFREFSDKGLTNEDLAAIVQGKSGRYKKPIHRMAARHLLDVIIKGKSLDIAYERIDGKVPQTTVEVSLTPAQAQAMTEDELRKLLHR